MKRLYGGIDLGGSYIKAGILSPDGRIIFNFVEPSRVNEGVQELAANLQDVGKRLMREAGDNGGELVGIGIGSPGTIKYPEGTVTGASPNIPGWVGTTISSLFSNFPVPIKADNDANCMGLAESMFGAGKGTRNGFYLTLGTGVGGAIVINGELLRGASFCAGEFGHMVFKYNGAKCKTGRRGCLEQYVAAPALIRNTTRLLKIYKSSVLGKSSKAISPKLIFEAYSHGDRLAEKVITENAAMVGVAIGSVVNLLNPEIVVIGGGLALGGERYIDMIRKHAMEFAFESTTSVISIKAAEFGNEAGWIGAACLNIEMNK